MNWSTLNHLQLGKYGEYLAKMEFTKHGFDVYTAEVDDKGIDFIVRNNADTFFEIQVKSIRDNNYVFMRKEVFTPHAHLYLALLIFNDNTEPLFLLIPSMDWLTKKNDFLVEHNYEGKKSAPEWGINVTARVVEQMKAEYSLSQQLHHFMPTSRFIKT